jgi:hypothetical protein
MARALLAYVCSVSKHPALNGAPTTIWLRKPTRLSLLIPCRMACRIASKASSVRSGGIIGQCGAVPKAR